MSPGLIVVDKLTITILVDNTINWLSKFPPEFTQEVRIHLAQHDHGTHNKELGVRVLDFENFCCGMSVCSTYAVCALTRPYRRSRFLCTNRMYNRSLYSPSTCRNNDVPHIGNICRGR